MNWETLLKDNLSIIIAVGGTLGGATIGLLASYLTKKEERKRLQLTLEKEYQHKYFTERIDSYVSETINHMESAYWIILDVKMSMSVEDANNEKKLDEALEPKLVDYNKRLVELREKERQIRARIEAFNDEELSEAYTNFHKKVNSFRTQGWDKQWDYLKEAIPFATTIFKKIGPEKRLSIN